MEPGDTLCGRGEISDGTRFNSRSDRPALGENRAESFGRNGFFLGETPYKSEPGDILLVAALIPLFHQTRFAFVRPDRPVLEERSHRSARMQPVDEKKSLHRKPMERVAKAKKEPGDF
jgi:hypothetical protein